MKQARPVARRGNMPSDSELERELHELSIRLYGCIGRAGELGPTKDEWNHYRSPHLCPAKHILLSFGLSSKAEGWGLLLNRFALLRPNQHDIQVAARRRTSAPLTGNAYIAYDDDYPELTGTASAEVSYRQLEDGTVIKTTRHVFSIR